MAYVPFFRIGGGGGGVVSNVSNWLYMTVTISLEIMISVIILVSFDPKE